MTENQDTDKPAVKVARTDLLKDVVMILAAAVVAMVSYWLVAGRNYITRAEAQEIVSKEAPYVQDRKYITESLGKSDRQDSVILAAVEKNSREIMAMRLQIERLLVVKPADVYRKLEELEKRIAEQTPNQSE